MSPALRCPHCGVWARPEDYERPDFETIICPSCGRTADVADGDYRLTDPDELESF